MLGDPGRQGGCGLSCCALPGGPSILQKWSRSLLSLGKIKEWFRKASGLPAGLRQGCLRRQTGPRSLHRGRLRRRRGFRGSTGGGGASASPREEAGPQDSGRGSGRAASGGGGASAAPQEEAGPRRPQGLQHRPVCLGRGSEGAAGSSLCPRRRRPWSGGSLIVPHRLQPGCWRRLRSGLLGLEACPPRARAGG